MADEDNVVYLDLKVQVAKKAVVEQLVNPVVLEIQVFVALRVAKAFAVLWDLKAKLARLVQLVQRV